MGSITISFSIEEIMKVTRISLEGCCLKRNEKAKMVNIDVFFNEGERKNPKGIGFKLKETLE